MHRRNLGSCLYGRLAMLKVRRAEIHAANDRSDLQFPEIWILLQHAEVVMSLFTTAITEW
jgi:hypothetical protein